MMREPEQVAQATLDAHAIRDDWRRTGEQIRALIVEAIEQDRADRAAAEVTCEHGNRPGHCPYTACPHFGEPFETDPVRKTVEVLADHDDRMVVARRVARYHIGDSAWAHVIVGAYLNPDSSQRALEEEMRDG